MRQLSLLYTRLGLDGLIIIILALVGIGSSVYSFVGGNQVNDSVLVGVLSLLLVEVVLQRFRLDKATHDIIKSLNGVTVELYESNEDFSKAKCKLLQNAHTEIFDTELCLPTSYSPLENGESSYDRLLRQKLWHTKDKITFKYVHVIYNREQFEFVVQKFFEYREDSRFYVGCLAGGKQVIPALNIMIFDNKHFLIGGYYGPSLQGYDKNVYVTNELLGRTLSHYCDYLWRNSTLFNNGQKIDWQAIKAFGLQIGLSIEDLNAVITKAAESAGYKKFIPFV